MFWVDLLWTRVISLEALEVSLVESCCKDSKDFSHVTVPSGY
jgi:hypothetical protein